MRKAEQVSRRLKLRHLKTLVAVVEHGSMAQAAQSLAVSQPVVSKTIADLEGLLGMRLLDRGPQGITPTVCGSALAKRSISIFDDIKTGVVELETLADPSAGELRIGCTEVTSATLVPSVIDRMSRDYPRMTFEVVIADQSTLLDRDLRGRRVDLAVGPFTEQADDLAITLLHNFRLHVVSSRSSMWANRRKITLKELVNERWVLPGSAHPVSAMLSNAFQRSGLEAPRRIVTVTSARFTSTLIARGEFLGVLVSPALNDLFATLKVLPVKLPVTTWPVSVAKLKNRALSPAADRFVECASMVLRSMTKGAGR